MAVRPLNKRPTQRRCRQRRNVEGSGRTGLAPGMDCRKKCLSRKKTPTCVNCPPRVGYQLFLGGHDQVRRAVQVDSSSTYLDGRQGYKSVANDYGLDHVVVKRWVDRSASAPNSDRWHRSDVVKAPLCSNNLQ